MSVAKRLIEEQIELNNIDHDGTDIEKSALNILQHYLSVARGDTQGAGGVYAADGKATLVAVTFPVEMLEHLAEQFGISVPDRVRKDRT